MDRLTLDTREIMQVTGWGRDYVRGLVRSGKLINVGTRRRILVPRTTLMNYLEQPQRG